MPDTRDLLEELESLELEEEPTEGERGRMEAIRKLREEVSGFEDGVQLITEDESEDYFRELAFDVGYMNNDNQLEYYVDWKRWAEDCLMDYTSIEFDGETYYYQEG